MLFILPDTVPVHFDISGAPDRWGSKFELLLLPVILIASAFVLGPMAKSYRKKAEETDDEKEKAEYYFAPDTKELLKGSLKERYDAYRIAITTGFKTRNEIRYMEDDDAIEGLDMISLGLGEVLLNADTGEIFVPNTNSIAKMGANGTNLTNNANGEGVNV
jgi:hypothetical protein